MNSCTIEKVKNGFIVYPYTVGRKSDVYPSYEGMNVLHTLEEVKDFLLKEMGNPKPESKHVNLR